MRMFMQQTSVPSGIFKTIGASEASLSLENLLEQVSSGIGRVEIIGRNEECVCVLLSKTELEALERALSILSGTKGAQEMRDLLNAIANAANGSVEVPVQVV